MERATYDPNGGRSNPRFGRRLNLDVHHSTITDAALLAYRLLICLLRRAMSGRS